MMNGQANRVAGVRPGSPWRWRRLLGLGGVCLALAVTQAPHASKAADPPKTPSAPAASAPVTFNEQLLQPSLTVLKNQLKSPGLVVGIQFGKQAPKISAVGVRNLSNGDRMQPNDKFRIGSVTKHFISICVLQLIGEHKLALEDTLEKWLPGVLKKVDGKKITVRNLLNHTSGIANYSTDKETLLKVYTPPGYKFNTPSELLSIADRIQPAPAQSAPGTFSYSNTNYTLLAMIATKADGIPNYDWSSLVKKRILDPVGMTETSIPKPGDRTIPGGQQHGYINWQNFLRVPPAECAKLTPPCADKDTEFTEQDTSGAWASGAIISTAGDLLKLLDAEMRGSLLGPTLLAMREKDFISANDPGRPYLEVGLGIYRDTPFRSIGHFGAISGFNATIQYQKDRDMSVVVLSNRSAIGDNVSAVSLYVHQYLQRLTSAPALQASSRSGGLASFDGSPQTANAPPPALQSLSGPTIQLPPEY
jgi:D-alanyl-D-alanine carboxypeptidase